MYTSTLLFMNIGTPELMAIMFVVLLLFGGKKLPELARGLGKGIREFKDASDGVKREIHRNINAVNEEMDFETKKTKQISSDYSSSNYSSDEYDYQSAEDLSHNANEYSYTPEPLIESETSASSESAENLTDSTKPRAKKARSKSSNKTTENN